MRFLVFLFFLCFSITLNAQYNFKGEVIYKYSFSEDSKSIDVKKEPSKKMYKKFTGYLNDNQSVISFQLNFNKITSYYRMKDVLGKEGDISFEFASMLVGGDEEVYSNLESGVQIVNKEVLGDLYLIENSLKNDWVLLPESKVISGYECFKATLLKKTPKGNLEITAWYAPELPYNFGPRAYGGLPGLILELTQKNITFSAKSIRITPVVQYDIEKPVKGIRITQKDFEQILTGYNEGKSGN